jgi:hypothetical protein
VKTIYDQSRAIGSPNLSNFAAPNTSGTTATT